jgi:diguanylate cyclase (GGDEF)-like protein
MGTLPGRGGLKHALAALLENEAVEHDGRQRLLEFLRKDENSHSQLIHLLTHLEYGQSEARKHWESIENHRAYLAQCLDRDAGLQVAILDYFFNVHPKLRNPKVIEITSFLETERDAFTDALTGLYNRLYFDTSLRRETVRAHRYGLTFSLVMLDLDDFKNVNDRHGHLVGDDALAVCSEVIRDSVREIDVPCRYGGEEFALILPETNRSGAYIVSERIRTDLESEFDRRLIRDNRVHLSISGGVAIFPVDSPSADGLLTMADRALYRSKRGGKNQITLHAEEKRRSPRFETVRTLSFHPTSPEIKGLATRTKNLSRTGALVESRVPLRIGTELSLRIEQKNRKFALKGKVVRLEEFQHGQSSRYDVGIAFVADNEDELRQLDGLTAELYRPLHHAV